MCGTCTEVFQSPWKSFRHTLHVGGLGTWSELDRHRVEFGEVAPPARRNVRNRAAANVQMDQRNAPGIYVWILKYKNTQMYYFFCVFY